MKLNYKKVQNMFLNKITGEISVAEELRLIPGNIINRGLSNDWIKVDAISMEYARLVKQLEDSIRRSQLGNFNTIKAINDLKR